jgi:1A family penicillin-binding protein
VKNKRFGKRRKKSVFKKLFLKLFLGGAVFLLILGAATAIYIVVIIRDLPSPDDFSTRQIVESTKLYDRTGQTLLYEIHGEEKRTIIPFNEIPNYVKWTTIVAEDLNFYNQPAFDWRAIVRAFLKNLSEGRFAQGGSTITQQLVRNIFLTPEKTLTRKIKELILAIKLESKYTKDEILNFYLNQIPYGSNAYGVEAASQIYFGKSVRNVTLAEAATLAALIKAPTYYSPWGNHLKELNERRLYILNRLVENNYISAAERDKAAKEKLKYLPPSLGTIKAPHFSLAVKDYLLNRYGENLVMNGGLKVITTLDVKMQELAEKAVREGAERNEKLYQGKNAALVAEDPKTGQILALVGSRDYFDLANDGNFNIAIQGLRQPGSALKPFVYLTAFQKGYSPKTKIFDVPTEFDVRGDPTKSYRPENFDNKFVGPISLESALAESRNVPAVKILYLAGFDDVLKNLHKFGITTLNERWRYGLSLTLGGGEVKLIDLVKAYATLSQDGKLHRQTFVLKITDHNGNIIEEYHDESESVIDPQYPRLINYILSDPELRRPIFQASLPLTIYPNHEVALKTGTTEDYRDAWAIGYTRFLVVGVWAGNNDNTPMVRHGSSILAAVPIWNAFLKEVINKYEPEPFEKPEPLNMPAKPMLNGEWKFIPTIGGRRYPQIHSILYYVKKEDPLGDPPDNPFQDPQFKNWEDGVLNWAKSNLSNFYEYNWPIPENQQQVFQSQKKPRGEIIIDNIKPENGSFVNLPLTIEADLYSPEGLGRVELYFNRKLVNGFNLFSDRYHYLYYLVGEELKPQNLVEIKVADRQGNEVKETIVLFH